MFEKVDATTLYEFALKEQTLNYFICYTLNNHQSYEAAWVYKEQQAIKCAVFLRKTGNLQIAYQKGYDLKLCKSDLESLLLSIDWKQAIVHTEVMTLILSMQSLQSKLSVREGAYIAVCPPERFKIREINSDDQTYEIVTLTENQLPSVIDIYKEVFDGFASESYMRQKLQIQRGRALGLMLNQQLISVAQTDYETPESALIVGVATRKKYQGQSYGRICFEALGQILATEGKTQYLQYDSPIAGNLYQSTGFENYERVYHINKTNI